MHQVSPSTIKAGPAARRVAAMRGIALHAISGTGPNGWVTKYDALRATPASPAKGSAPAYSATTAPFFHASRDVEWAEPCDSSALLLFAAIGAAQSVPTMLSRWTGNGVNRPIAPTVIYVHYAETKATALRVPARVYESATELEAVLNQAKSTAAPFDGTYSILATDCMIVHDFAGDSVATAAVLPANGISASLAIGAARVNAGVRDGGIEALSIRTATVSSDHRLIDGAVAAQWLQTFARVIEQAACAS